jgi:hypothetical protein
MTPEQILAAMAEAYARCVSYRDSGRVVARVLLDGSHGGEGVRPFRTAFVRPDRFRFEFSLASCRYIAWAGEEEVRMWWGGQPGVQRPESLGQALAGASAVSGSSSHAIPALLLPDRAIGPRLTDLAELAPLPGGQIGGVACHRLQGRFAVPRLNPAEEVSPMTLWVDRATLLVRRIELSARAGEFRTEVVTDYQPEADVAVSDDELAFGAPDRP